MGVLILIQNRKNNDYPRTQRTELLFVLLLLFELPSLKFTLRAFVVEFSVALQ